MKKQIFNILSSVIVISVLFIGACEERVHQDLAVKYCTGNTWDTITVKSFTPVSVDAYKTGLPVLKDCWGTVLCINVCEFKTLKTYK